MLPQMTSSRTTSQRPQSRAARFARLSLIAILALVLTSCGGGGGDGKDAGAAKGGALEGAVHVDGSSTVFPITEAVAEEFRAVQPKVQVTVGVSGTGGGFKKFCAGEIDINDASRPIKAEELAKAIEGGIEFIELPVAYDGLSIVVNPKNDWVDQLTVEELRRIWQPESAVKNWADVRPGWPARPIHLYGPGHDSGTFDYFTEAINGKAGACRSDYSASEDDNVLVQGIEGDTDALGYFGFAYYKANSARLRVIPVDGGAGPVTPSDETITSGAYEPLSRPVFIYVSKAASARPEVLAFVSFYLTNAPALVHEVGYTPLPAAVSALATRRFEKRVVGSVYKGVGGGAGQSLEALFADNP